MRPRLLPTPAAAPSPLQALLDCHERIRRFCGGMLLLCEQTDPDDPRVVNTAERVARLVGFVDFGHHLGAAG